MSELLFEIIDESEIIHSGRTRKKKTKSLFDIPMIERNYWDNTKDDYQLLLSLVRMRIRNYNRKGKVLNLEEDRNYIRLDYKDQVEMIQYQKQNVQISNEE